MEFITAILAILSLALLGVAIWLATRIRSCQSQIRKIKPDPRSILFEYASPLIRDEDPLGNIVKFIWFYEHSQEKPRQAYASCKILMKTLQESWGLEEFVQYRETVPFDRKLHRVDQEVTLAPGDPVIVTEPGWKLGNSIIKYPAVKSVMDYEVS